jgi:serine/threonine protein kinase/Tol biopolymer transport system component
MALTPNTQLGRYEIRSQIGAGGMGEVYRAHDPKINRDVAIKVLPSEFSADSDRLRRFEQEAQAAGRLNHPNILAIHDVDTHDGALYVVSELLEGQTLREQLNGTGLPTRKAIDYALQIASGLAAAHGKSIVHRDIKPENLFVTTDGRVKILDFGLAKLTGEISDNDAQSDVLTRRVKTDSGMVMGTVGYMSPEQVRGNPADHRADIFSLGAVLYEMLSGKRPFRRESAVETLNAILKEDPPELSESNSQINPALERVVTHCLEKSPEQRFQSARDVAFALESLSGLSSSRTMSAALPIPVGRQKNRERLLWIAAVALPSLALLAFAFSYLRRPQVETYAVRFTTPLPEKAAGVISLAISPDGRRLAFVASSEGHNQIWVRALDSLTALPLAGTEDAGNLFWSPDSRSLGFFAGGKLKKVDAAGGPSQTLCDAGSGRGGTWNRDGVIVFTPDTQAGLYRVPASGGTPAQITTPDVSKGEDSNRWPVFLPDGRHFIFLARSRQPENSGIYVGSLDSNDRKLLFPSQSSAQYAAPGYLLFIREKTLMAQQFDATRLQLAGDPMPLAEQVGSQGQGGTNRYLSYFSVSENGALVYMTGNSDNRHYAWFDRSGKEVGSINLAGDVNDVVLSPDGKRAAIQLTDHRGSAVNQDIWLIDIERNISTRFTFNPAIEDDPVWSPDGTHIAFTSEREGQRDIYQKLSSGAGGEELLLKSDVNKETTDWSSDGRYILYENEDRKTKKDLWVLPLFGDKQPFPFLITDFPEFQGHVSPDGHWIAFTSEESGKPEICVQSFPAAGGKRQVSTGGGAQPVWRRDGREVFYINPDKKLMSVDVQAGATFEVGVPKPLFDTRVENYTYSNRYAVSPDGQRFLINVPVGAQTSTPITVVLNWTADLKR